MADLLSVVVGGALALAGGIATKLLENRRERRAFAYALAGEIHAIVQIIEERQYQQGFAAAIDSVKKFNKPSGLRISITQKYFIVFETNVLKIGLLPARTAKDVASFYTFAKSLIEDMMNEQGPPRDAQADLHRLEQMANLLARLSILGA